MTDEFDATVVPSSPPGAPRKLTTAFVQLDGGA